MDELTNKFCDHVNDMTKLKVLLIDMDIPESKFDIDKIENVRWLQRNISIRNSEHKNFNKAIELIVKLLKK